MIWATAGSGSTAVKEGPLREAGVIEEAMLYKALWGAGGMGPGMTPAQADATPLWQIGVILGAADELKTPEESKVEKVAGTGRHRRPGRSHDEINRRLIKERIAYKKGLGPKPEAPPVSAAVLSVLGASGIGGVS